MFASVHVVPVSLNAAYPPSFATATNIPPPNATEDQSALLGSVYAPQTCPSSETATSLLNSLIATNLSLPVASVCQFPELGNCAVSQSVPLFDQFTVVPVLATATYLPLAPVPA